MTDHVRPRAVAAPAPSFRPGANGAAGLGRAATAASPSLAATAGAIVVVPTYNERENLPVFVRRVLALGPAFRVLVVDDNSPDGTGAVADALAAAHPGRVSVLHRPAKLGLGPAYVAGLGAALAAAGPDELVATMDADLSHDPADLPRLVAIVAAGGCDVAVGSRYVPGGGTRGWPLGRRLLSRLGGRYAATILGLPLADPTSGFKVFRPAMLRAVDVRSIGSDGYVFNIEIAVRALRRGGRVAEVPICFAERVAGRSKLSRRIMAEAAVRVWRLRLDQGRSHPERAGGNAPPRYEDRGAAPGCRRVAPD